ncbi:DUF930 domain-containing protein [Methylopila henanensis]|uniref:DUF930 domain-containing protein n=1 Tax=Methylopila henanensis TaxID=873516 RepID=A0ABW4K3F6_9HYPH
MRKFVSLAAAGALASSLVASVPAYAFSYDRRTEAALRKLEPETRFNQVCDLAAMEKIRKNEPELKPDRMAIDALAEPERKGDTLSGTGAAVRAGGVWRRLAFTCSATPDRMTVTALRYTLGAPIPEQDWERYGLWR